jgi:hypothetical protein
MVRAYTFEVGPVVEQLDRILQMELAGVIYYTHYKRRQRPHDKRSSSFRLTRADPRRSRGDDGRGDLVESPEPDGSDASKSRDRLRRLALLIPSCGGHRANRGEKRVIYGNGLQREKQLDPNNPIREDSQTTALMISCG